MDEKASDKGRVGDKGLRLIHLDYLRVLSAFFVIAIHASDSLLYQYSPGSPEYVYAVVVQSIVRMGVPIFFMISGALLLRNPSDSIYDFYATRLPRILVPLVVYSVFYVASKNPAALFSFQGWVEFFLLVLTGRVFYHLWFVYSIVGIYFLVPLLSLALNNAPRRLVTNSVIALVFFHCLETYSSAFGVRLGFDFSFVGTWFVYFLMGYALSLFDYSGKSKVLVLFFVVMYLVTIGIRLWVPGLSPFDKGLNLYLMCAAFFSLAMSVSPWLSQYRRFGFVIARLSTLSYGVYLVHAFYLNVVLGEGFMLAAHTLWSAYWGVPVMVLITVALSLPTAWIVDRLFSDPIGRLAVRGLRKLGARSSA